MMTPRKSSNRFLQLFSKRPAAPAPDPETERDLRWAAWIERMAGGDVEALSGLYDESSRVIFSLVMEILHDRAAAEESLVEIYNQARGKAAKFSSRRQSPLNWLIAMARDVAVARLRSAPVAPKPEPDLFQHKRHAAAFAMARLSDEQRSILEMTYMCGLAANEVAEILGVSKEHVAKQIVAAMTKLRTGSQNPSAVVVRMSSMASV